MFPLIYQTESSSTNDDVLKYILPETQALGVYTFYQTHGRGQYGNIWKSSKGQNLAYTLAINERFVKISDSLFNFHTAVIERDYLANLTNCEVKIKWPNDIIINRKKVSGILIEKVKVGSVFFYIVGMGINILQKDFHAFPKAGSLLTQSGKAFEPISFTENFHNYFTEKILNADGEKVLEDFNRHLFRKDEVSAFARNNVRQNGIIRSVDENGFIRIEMEDGKMHHFFHKEIEMLY